MKICLVLALALLFTLPVLHAQDLKSCGPELQKFCPGKKEARELARCLLTQESNISKECKEELQRISMALKGPPRHSGGSLSAFGGLNPLTPPIPTFTYEGRHSPQNNSLLENKINVSSPAYMSASHGLMLSLAGGQNHFDDDLVLGPSNVVPHDLYRVELGAQYTYRMEGKKSWGLRGNYGYASDKVGDRPIFSLSTTYSFPNQKQDGQWIFLISISNNNPMANFIPLPGVIYLYRTERFTGLFGFPFTSMQWTPVSPWAFSLSLLGPTIFSEAAYGAFDHAQALLGFNWTQQFYLLSERRSEKERLTIEEKKLFLGGRFPITDFTRVELQAGSAFTRRLYKGQGLFNKSGGVAKLDSDVFMGWILKSTF